MIYLLDTANIESIRSALDLIPIGGVTTNPTILTSNQALMAAVVGADFVAPYVNRIDSIAGNGVQVVIRKKRYFRV